MTTQAAVLDDQTPPVVEEVAPVTEEPKPQEPTDWKAEAESLRAENARLQQRAKSAEGKLKEGTVTPRDLERVREQIVQETRASYVNLRREILARADLDPQEKQEEMSKLDAQQRDAEQATSMQEVREAVSELLNQAIETFDVPQDDSHILALADAWKTATTLRQMAVVNKGVTSLLRDLRAERTEAEATKQRQEAEAKRKAQNQEKGLLELGPRGTSSAAERSIQALEKGIADGTLELTPEINARLQKHWNS